MKNLILIITLILSFNLNNLYCQNNITDNDVKKYYAKKIMYVFRDPNTKEIKHELAWGKNLEIFYDEIMKTIDITFYEATGQKVSLTLYYIMETNDAWKMTLDMSKKDPNNDWWVVFDPTKRTSIYFFPINNISNGFMFNYKTTDISTVKNW